MKAKEIREKNASALVHKPELFKKYYCTSCAQRLFPFYEAREVSYNKEKNLEVMQDALHLLWSQFAGGIDISRARSILKVERKIIPSSDDLVVRPTFLAQESAIITITALEYAVIGRDEDLLIINKMFTTLMFQLFFYVCIWREGEDYSQFNMYDLSVFEKKAQKELLDELRFFEELDEVSKLSNEAVVAKERSKDLRHLLLRAKSSRPSLF